MESSEPQQQRQAMVGSYRPIPDLETDVRAQSVAEFAVSSLADATRTYSFAGSLASSGSSDIKFKLVKGSRQVVAGMNYRLFIMLQDTASGDCLGAFAVEVYDRFGSLSVTNWGKEISCNDAEAMLKTELAMSDNYEGFFGN